MNIEQSCILPPVEKNYCADMPTQRSGPIECLLCLFVPNLLIYCAGYCPALVDIHHEGFALAEPTKLHPGS